MNNLKNKLILPLLALLTMFSSCLGESDGSTEESKCLVYITNQELYGRKMALAATSNLGYVFLDDSNVNDMTLGKCYYIAFKLRNSQISGNIGKPDYLQAGDEINESTFSITSGDDLTGVEGEPIAIKSFGSKFTSSIFPQETWLFNFVGTGKRGTDGSDKIEAYFYYNTNNQVDEKKEGEDTGAQLTSEDNKIIIDIIFTRRPKTEDVNDKTLDISVERASKFESLYASIRPTTNAQEFRNGKLIAVKFRYLQESLTVGGEPEVKYLGTWSNGETILPTYYFYYSDDSN